MADSLLKNFYDAIPPALYSGFGIQISGLPATPVDCVGIKLNDAGPSTKFFGQVDAINYPIVEVSVRSETYTAGYDVCESIRQYFSMYYNNDFLGIKAQGSTIHLGKDADGHHRFLSHFEIIVKE